MMAASLAARGLLLAPAGPIASVWAARAAGPAWLLAASDGSRAFSSQHEEALRARPASAPPTSQPAESPPITPDSSTGGGAHVSDGRSSQTTSAHLAEPALQQLVHKVLRVYEARSLEEQRALIAELYDPRATYENNVALLRGRDEITQRFALLPMSTHSVRVAYDKPVVLGATTSAPEALDDLASKGDLQVEVSNTQQLSFDRGHSLWRLLLLPHGDLELSVLTRLTLSQEHKVLHHRDIWTNHSSTWLAPLQRCWGVMEKVAGAQAQKGAAKAGPPASSTPRS